MEPAANGILAAAAIVIALVTLVLTQVRTNKLEDRTAARDTVDFLRSQNQALHSEVSDVRSEIATLNVRMLACETARLKLTDENVYLMKRIMEFDMRGPRP